jgi:hypothetical protein
MTSTLLAISAAYAVMGVLLLSMGFTSRFAWGVKAAAIVVTSAFFIEVFFATKGLLGWPGTGKLPPKFQLLWTRVVEPDPHVGDPGAIFLWVEEVDSNNVPMGIPRSYRLPYSRPLADRSLKARDDIMSGEPQEGTAEGMDGERLDTASTVQTKPEIQDGGIESTGGAVTLDEVLKETQHVQFKPMTGPALPAKP